MRKGRAKRGRTYEVKHPGERYKDLSELFKKKTRVFDQAILFPEMEEEKFDNVALEYLKGRNPTFQEPINKILGLVEV